MIEAAETKKTKMKRYLPPRDKAYVLVYRFLSLFCVQCMMAVVDGIDVSLFIRNVDEITCPMCSLMTKQVHAP